MNYNDLFEKVLSVSPEFSDRIPVGKNGAKAFKCTPKTKKMKLWEIFGNGAEMPMEFNNAYIAATSGAGYESRRITQLNSSSLLALLCFWNVSEYKPLIIDGVKYTQVFFEVENKVFDHNSSIDILLISEDNSVYLFLESKFTEILNPSNKYWLKKKYYDLYNAIRNYLPITVSPVETRKHKVKGEIESKDEFFITQNEKRYYAGIKQMISHIIGLLRGPGEDKNAPHKEAYSNTANIKIKLGTILYDFSKFDVEDFSKKYKDYVEFYNEIFKNNADIISKIAAAPNLKDEVRLNVNTLEIIEKPLTYQEVFDGPNSDFLLPNVSEFYKINKSNPCE